MIELADLLPYGYWLAILGLVLWWVRGMRRAAKPPVRTDREQTELRNVQAALDRLEQPAEVTPPRPS